MLHYYNSGPILKCTQYQISTQAPTIWTYFCNLRDTDSSFFLKKSWETVTIISQIGCYVSSIDLGLDRQNSSLAQCHKQNSHAGQLLVHVNFAAMQKPQMLSILHMSPALVTQHTKCMHPIILLSEAFLALPHFSTLSPNTICWKSY
jgi:hypothetical protein